MGKPIPAFAGMTVEGAALRAASAYTFAAAALFADSAAFTRRSISSCAISASLPLRWWISTVPSAAQPMRVFAPPASPVF